MNIFTKVLIPITLAFSSTVSLAAADYDDLHQQMNIMADIIKTSANKQSQANTPKVSAIESYYLAGQGSVFTLQVARSYGHSMNRVLAISPVRAPQAPQAPRAVKDLDQEGLFGQNFEVVIEEALEDAAIAMEYASEQLQQNSEEQRQLREQEREISYQLRDLEREKRDLNYQKMHLDDQQKTENEQELAVLEQRKAELDSAKQKLLASQKQYQAKAEQAKAEREQLQQAYYANLATNVSNVLCNYGGGLKALPNDEKVSVIIKGAGSKTRSASKDKVIVFKKSDIKSCVVEKISAKQLFAKANSYDF